LRLGGKPDEDPGIGYGVFHYRGGREEEEELEAPGAALDRYPDSARAHLKLGRVSLSLDRLEEAVLSPERAPALHDSPRGDPLLGTTYLRQGKYDAAGVHLKRSAVEGHPLQGPLTRRAKDSGDLERFQADLGPFSEGFLAETRCRGMGFWVRLAIQV
jgi:hypothetical protein